MRKHSKDPRLNYIVYLTTTDSEDGSTVSDDGFSVLLTNDEAATVDATPKNQRGDLVLKLFIQKIKTAVTQWFETAPNDLRETLDEYCFGYDYENDADEGQSELDYALSKFTARCVAYIPDEISGKNGFIQLNVDVTHRSDYADSLFDAE
jgi:hypothetical protein